MSELEVFFDQRKKEIEQFFNFIGQLEIDQNSSYTIIALGENMNEEKAFGLEQTQIQILKSNCFLLLYNSIEGTVNKSLEYIIDTINDTTNLTHKDVIDEIQHIWLKHSLQENGNIYEIDLRLVEHIEVFINQTININLKAFQENNKGYFSVGNLNDDKIHNEFFPKLGILPQKITESKLDEIKNFRNQLAHGSISFSEMGAGKTFKQILEYKDKTFKYLEKYILEIEKYIHNKDYKK